MWVYLLKFQILKLQHSACMSLERLMHLSITCRVTLIINQQIHYIKFHIKTLKIASTYFDPKIILRELRCSLLKSF